MKEVYAIPTAGATEPTASARTDAAGALTVALAPGTYWVYVPVGALQTAGGGGPALITPALPNGMRVTGWTAAEVIAGHGSEVTIDMTVANP